MALVMQKEVAERLVARDTKESLLSLSVRLFGAPAYRTSIPRSAFSPPPTVDSALVTITDIHPVPVPLQEAFLPAFIPHFRKKEKWF